MKRKKKNRKKRKKEKKEGTQHQVHGMLSKRRPHAAFDPLHWTGVESFLIIDVKLDLI